MRGFGAGENPGSDLHGADVWGAVPRQSRHVHSPERGCRALRNLTGSEKGGGGAPHWRRVLAGPMGAIGEGLPVSDGRHSREGLARSAHSTGLM